LTGGAIISVFLGVFSLRPRRPCGDNTV